MIYSYLFLMLIGMVLSQRNIRLLRRIIDGEESTDKYPWLVSIRNEKRKHVCAGSILTLEPEVILVTAAHCFNDREPDQMKQFTCFGNRFDIEQPSEAENGVDFEVLEVVLNDQYTKDTMANDIAFMRLRPTEQTAANMKFLQPIPLDKTEGGTQESEDAPKGEKADTQRDTNKELVENTGLNANEGDPNENVAKAKEVQGVDKSNILNEHLYSAGWGSVKDGETKANNILLRIPMNIAAPEKCAKFTEGKMPPDSTLCVVGANAKSDTCQGDSGGPLFTHSDGKQVLIGIVSFGVECGKREQKEDGLTTLTPAVYTKIAAFRSFIDEFLAKFDAKAL